MTASNTADKIVMGDYARIVHIQEPELCLYCQDLGLLPGKTVRLLHKAPFGGPMAFQLEDTTISLRRDEARNICVEAVPEPICQNQRQLA